MILAVVGGSLVLAASVLLYLSSPNQRWGRLPCTPRAAALCGAAVFLVGSALMLTWAGAATAVFIVMTLAMTAWSVVPLAVAWWRRDGEQGR